MKTGASSVPFLARLLCAYGGSRAPRDTAIYAALLTLERSARSGDAAAVRRGLAELVPGFGDATATPGTAEMPVPVLKPRRQPMGIEARDLTVRPFPLPKFQPAAPQMLQLEADRRGKAFA